MKQGPPQIPPNPEKLKFEILRPGDLFIHEYQGRTINHMVTQNQRIITAGEKTSISLGLLDRYFLVENIYVDELLRRQGIGSKLYEEALKLAKAERKKGLISSPSCRTEVGNNLWDSLKEAGRVSTITIENHTYEVLLC